MSAVCIVWRLLYKPVLRVGISLYTHRRSVGVVLLLLLLLLLLVLLLLLLLLLLTSRRMLSSVALFTDLMAVYIEIGAALTVLLHRS